MFDYEMPEAKIISFVALERLATDDGDRTRSADGNEGVNLPSQMPTFNEGVEDW